MPEMGSAMLTAPTQVWRKGGLLWSLRERAMSLSVCPSSGLPPSMILAPLALARTIVAVWPSVVGAALVAHGIGSSPINCTDEPALVPLSNGPAVLLLPQVPVPTRSGK